MKNIEIINYLNRMIDTTKYIRKKHVIVSIKNECR